MHAKYSINMDTGTLVEPNMEPFPNNDTQFSQQEN